MLKKVIIGAVVLAGIAVTGTALRATHTFPFEQAAAAPAPPAPVPIVAGVVAQHDVPIYLNGVGTAIAYNIDVVRAQIQGQIVSINFREVSMSTPATCSRRSTRGRYQAVIDQDMGSARARPGATRQRGRQSGPLYPARHQGVGDTATDRNPESAGRPVAGGDKGRSGADRSREGAAELHPTTSPIDGVVGIRQIDVGNIISPSSTNGLSRCDAARSDFADLHASRDSVAANPAATADDRDPLAVAVAYDQDNTMMLDSGELVLVNNEILQTTGSIQLKANFPNKDNRLWPGELDQRAVAARHTPQWPHRSSIGCAAGSERCLRLGCQSRPNRCNPASQGGAESAMGRR